MAFHFFLTGFSFIFEEKIQLNQIDGCNRHKFPSSCSCSLRMNVATNIFRLRRKNLHDPILSLLCKIQEKDAIFSLVYEIMQLVVYYRT